MTTLREARAILNWHTGRAEWLFIHIPKNAGVSLRKAPALSGRMISAEPYFHKSRAYTRAVAAKMRAGGEHHGFQHARWRDIHPKVTSRLTAVGILRNPWARTVSRWQFARLAETQGKDDPRYRDMRLEEFLEERHIYGHEPFYWHRVIRGWYPQADYVTDEAGTVRVDLLRFESLAEDSMRYFGLDQPVRKRNVSTKKRTDYREFYTDRTIQIVADWYAADIEMFGFDFDTPARRNLVLPDSE
ncbi:hypothetical protein DDZ14_10820 [Maritimibacter sp. 55A14]|uniref:sulfotransferase family 2 domain-containing protein n=1 Tax=Maritimibacter sp. 55A14 TaxID=2174844 RepID=UPI000D61AA6C|nr:sulfotransferase family 2 domain-containing protein [Maritimibacter sp. 55A14]PWE32221.1 hypothetical protein DDZ14_10820 [Maritimibacter sp. 55A14]